MDSRPVSFPVAAQSHDLYHPEPWGAGTARVAQETRRAAHSYLRSIGWHPALRLPPAEPQEHPKPGKREPWEKNVCPYRFHLLWDWWGLSVRKWGKKTFTLSVWDLVGLAVLLAVFGGGFIFTDFYSVSFHVLQQDAHSPSPYTALLLHRLGLDCGVETQNPGFNCSTTQGQVSVLRSLRLNVSNVVEKMYLCVYIKLSVLV